MAVIVGRDPVVVRVVLCVCGCFYVQKRAGSVLRGGFCMGGCVVGGGLRVKSGPSLIYACRSFEVFKIFVLGWDP